MLKRLELCGCQVLNSRAIQKALTLCRGLQNCSLPLEPTIMPIIYLFYWCQHVQTTLDCCQTQPYKFTHVLDHCKGKFHYFEHIKSVLLNAIASKYESMLIKFLRALYMYFSFLLACWCTCRQQKKRTNG